MFRPYARRREGKIRMTKFLPESDFQRIQRLRSENRDIAFDKILSGPDNRTRRWLVKYLEDKAASKKTELLKRAPPLVKPNQGAEITRQLHGLFEVDKNANEND